MLPWCWLGSSRSLPKRFRVLFRITGLTSVGFPGTIGFVSTELLVDGVIHEVPFFGLALVFASALNGVSTPCVMRMQRHQSWNHPNSKGRPLEILRELPEKLANANPEIALIGIVSLILLFGFGFWKSRSKNPWVKGVPAQVLVLLIAVPLGILFELSHEHTYTFAGHEYQLGEQFLVNIPSSLVNAIAFPEWSVFTQVDVISYQMGDLAHVSVCLETVEVNFAGDY